MTIGRGTDGKRDLLLLGLSAENVRRLTSGQPIAVTRESHGEGVPENWTIAIVYGVTEQAIHDEMKSLGAITPETKINKDPRL